MGDAKPCLTEVFSNASLSKRLPRSVWVCHTNAVLEGPIRYWKNLTERAEGRPRLRVWQIHVSWHDYVLFTIDSQGTLRQGLQWQKCCCTRIKKRFTVAPTHRSSLKLTTQRYWKRFGWEFAHVLNVARPDREVYTAIEVCMSSFQPTNPANCDKFTEKANKRMSA